MMETQDQDDSLYEHYAFTADSGQQPLRVDKFLMNRIEISKFASKRQSRDS